MIWIYIVGGALALVVLAFNVLTQRIINACETKEGYEQEGGIKL